MSGSLVLLLRQAVAPLRLLVGADPGLYHRAPCCALRAAAVRRKLLTDHLKPHFLWSRGSSGALPAGRNCVTASVPLAAAWAGGSPRGERPAAAPLRVPPSPSLGASARSP